MAFRRCRSITGQSIRAGLQRVLRIWQRLIVAAVVVLFVPSITRGEIHTGFALIPPGPAWDFSDSLAVAPPNGDVYWITLIAQSRSVGQRSDDSASAFPNYFLTNYPALIAYSPMDSSYAELTTAPADTTVYSESVEIFSYGVYVIRTKEGHYAKLRIESLGGGGITIEYSYQDDGTRVLVRTVAVGATTWGRVKSLYRE